MTDIDNGGSKGARSSSLIAMGDESKLLPSRIHYTWKEKKSTYDKRPVPEWRNMLQQKSVARTSKLREGLFQYEERRRIRIAETGWKNIVVTLPEKPKKVDFEAVNKLQKEIQDKKAESIRNRGNYCMVCWRIVHFGANRANCCHCMAVTHRVCIVSPEELVPISGLERLVVDKLLPQAVPWTCPDCSDDVEFNSQLQMVRERQHYRDSMEIFAIVKIQAFARMVRYRLDFVFAKIGFTLLQQLYHARKAWTALKIHEEKRLRPFRIRVHDVRLLVRSPDALDEENLDPPILSEPVSKRVGEISVGVYDARVRPGRHADGPDNRADQLLELLLHGHLESPEYNTSCYGKQPFTKGSLFLTICVHDIDSDRIERGEREIEGTRAHNLRQLYRVDAPLKLRKDLRAERISPSLLSYLGVPYPHPDPQNLEKIIDNYRVASFYIDNPYILIPRCSPSVSVTFTLSQVIAWPRAIAIGQSTQNLKRVLFLHKVSAWNQGLSPCNWTNLPEPDEGRRLLITLPDNISSENGGLRVTVSQDITKTAHSSSASSATFSPTRSKNRKSSISTLPKVSPKAPHSPTSKISSPKIFKSLTGSPSSNAPPHIPDTANDIFGGVITWSLLSITNENLNEGGYLLSIPRGSGDRGNLARREVWCVVVDRCFLSYLPIDSMKPRAYADLKHCYVTPMVDGIFRIDNEQAVSSSSSFKTLYFMGRNKQEGATWFRKLYTQSASNNTRKYSALDFLPGGVAAAFSILHIKGDEAGFNPRSFREDGDTTIRKMRTPGHRVTSLLASLRADPMLAFVYKPKEKDDFQDWDGSFDRSNQEPTRKLTINQMMKIKKARISDLVGRMKSFAGGDKEDTEEGSCWVGSDLAVAIATAVKTANRASSSSIVNITAMDGVDRRNKGTEATTIAAVTNESYPLKSSTLKGIRSSPCRPSNGLFLLFKSSKESKKGRQTIISLGDLSVGVRSEPVSKSRLARFNSMSCTPEERKKNFSAVGNT